MARNPGRPRLTMLKPRIETLNTARTTRELKPDQYRGTAAARGYDHRWRAFRERWLKAHPLCGDRLDGPSDEHSECVRSGRVTAGTNVDHIRPVSGPDDPTFLDERAVQTLCGTCHKVKTATQDGGLGHPVR